MREILTYQSIKENPKSARDTSVSIKKGESLNPKILKSAQDTNVSINTRES